MLKFIFLAPRPHKRRATSDRRAPRRERDRSKVTKAEWIDRFVMHLSKLEVNMEPHYLTDMAEELYDTYQLVGEISPEEAAQAEYDEWPPAEC